MTGDRSGSARGGSALVALLTVLALDLVRASGPLLDMAFTLGVASAAGAALATYVAPGLVAAVLVGAGRTGRGRGLPGDPVLTGVALLAVLRLVVQGLTAGARFGVGLAAVAVAVAVLVLAGARVAGTGVGGAAAAARAVAVGLAGHVGLQLCLGTWDATWRHDVVGWVVTAVLVAATAAAAWTSRVAGAAPADEPTPEPTPTPSGARLWALGLALGLAAMVAANPAFAAAQTTTPLALAGALVGLGWVLAAATAGARPGRGVGEAIALPLLVAGVMVLRHPAALVLLVALPPVVGWVLVRALAPRPGGAAPLSPGRAAASGALAGLGVILPLLVYQVDYDVPLPVPNWLAVVAGAAVLGGAAVRRSPGVAPAHPDPRTALQAVARRRRLATPLAAAVALLVAGTGLATARAVGATRASELTPGTDLGDTLTLVDWNLHYGVDPAGDLGLERIARTIEAQHPDVVTLQEVSRGWVMGGGADAATWLAERLGMRVAFGPAADHQFGNAVLTALPADHVRVTELPYGDGPQRRSAVSADVLVAGGPLRVTSVHLQHREENTPTRLDQLHTLLDAEGTAPPAVVAGDLNAEPGWPEIDLMTGDAGYVSAVDVAGDPAALTFSSTDPFQRIDWVLGRGVTFLEARVLTSAHSSDHLPVVVRLRVEAPAG